MVITCSKVRPLITLCLDSLFSLEMMSAFKTFTISLPVVLIIFLRLE